MSCYSHIRELRCIHPYLDSKTASTIAASIVHSKLDYCNCLLRTETDKKSVPSRRSSMTERNSWNVNCCISPWLAIALVFSARQHICLAHYMLSPVRLSVRQTGVYHRKTVQVRIVKFSPYGSPIP